MWDGQTEGQRREGGDGEGGAGGEMRLKRLLRCGLDLE